LHMFLGHFKLRKQIKGFINSNAVEPYRLSSRHEVLVNEMLNRGMKHNSVLTVGTELNYLIDEDKAVQVNRKVSFLELIKRCPNCNRRFQDAKHTAGIRK
jgi:hypothetical protein